MAGWADECPDGGMLARTLLDIPVVMFRDRQGKVAALLDRCPHRFAPLSKGRVEDDAITCGYHGLSFDGDGACVANPHGPITKRMRTPAFPIREAYRALWIWMGDSARADDSLLPDLAFIDRTPETAFSKGYLLGSGGYQLFVDNILDLTHADYLHPDTLGGGAFTRARATVEEREGSIGVQWHSFDETPSPLSAAMRGDNRRVDSWTEVEWYPPTIMTLRNGSVPAGTPRAAGGSVMNLHIMTPQTDRSTHYFYASTRDFAVDDADLNRTFAEARDRIFSTEDKPMIAAQQDRMGDADFWDLKPLFLRIDEAPVRVRRRLESMIAKERSEGAAADAAREPGRGR
jgi:vanillate O-demethylase monooxygenase subunit